MEIKDRFLYSGTYLAAALASLACINIQSDTNCIECWWKSFNWRRRVANGIFERMIEEEICETWYEYYLHSISVRESEKLWEESHNCGTDRQESVRDVVWRGWLSGLIELKRQTWLMHRQESWFQLCENEIVIAAWVTPCVIRYDSLTIHWIRVDLRRMSIYEGQLLACNEICAGLLNRTRSHWL